MIKVRDLVFTSIGAAIAALSVVMVHYLFTSGSVVTLYNATGMTLQNVEITYAETVLWEGDLPDGSIKSIPATLEGEGGMKVGYKSGGASVNHDLGYVSSSDSFKYDIQFRRDGSFFFRVCDRRAF